MAEYLWSNLVPGGRYTKVGPSFVVEKVIRRKKIFFSNPDHHFLPQRLNALLYAPMACRDLKLATLKRILTVF